MTARAAGLSVVVAGLLVLALLCAVWPAPETPPGPGPVLVPSPTPAPPTHLSNAHGGV